MKKLEELPCVQTVLYDAKKEIKKLTGEDVMITITHRRVEDNERKSVLQEIVCNYFNVSWKQMVSPVRTKHDSLVEARHAYMYLAHNVAKYTLTDVARDLNRDHTSVVHACKKVNGFYEVGDPLVTAIENIKKMLPEGIAKQDYEKI